MSARCGRTRPSRAAVAAGVALAGLAALGGPTAPRAHATTLALVTKVRVGAWPRALAVAPDGQRAYVATQLDRRLVVLVRATQAIERTVELGGRPEGLALSPDGKRLYVSLGDEGLVEVRDTGSWALVGTIPVAARPRGLAVSADGATLYVACARAGKLQLADTAALRVRAEIDVGWSPKAVALVPGTTLALLVHALGQSVYVIDVRARAVLRRIRGLGRRPLDVAVTRDGRAAWIPVSKKHGVLRLDVAGQRIAEAFAVGKGPAAVALTPSGKTLFAALHDEGRIAILPTRGGHGRPPAAKTGRSPTALALSPSGKTLYAACQGSHDVWIYTVR